MIGVRRLIKARLLRKKPSSVYDVDEQYYFGNYRDVELADVTAADHFAQNGWKEGRNPSAHVHTLYCAHTHMDGGRLAENPLVFLQNAERTRGAPLVASPQDPAAWLETQKAAISPFFDRAFYRSEYGTLVGERDVLDHFMTIGAAAGLRPSARFDLRHYLEHHVHIKYSNVNPLFHWVVLNRSRDGAAPPS